MSNPNVSDNDIFLSNVLPITENNVSNILNDDNDNEFDWITEHIKLNKMDHKYFREQMKKINIFFVYINGELDIKNVVNEPYDLVNGIISKDELFLLIEKRRKIGYLKYKIMDIILYNINIETENIQKYIQTNNNDMIFMKVLPLVNEIVIEPSLKVFHSLNSLYFIFKETMNDNNIKKTKRVRLNLTPIEISQSINVNNINDNKTVDNKRTTKKNTHL